MIKAVLFDLDGTLLNRDESVRLFCNGQYDRLNKFVGHVPKDTYVKRFIELDNRGYVWKDKVYQQLIDEFKIEGISWEELLKDYINEFKEHCVPFPNLNSMLETLKEMGLSLGMITNGRGQFQFDNIKALGIEEYFDTILISEWEGIKKPDPQIFIRALQKLNVLPEQSFYVGDHPENDMKAAQNIGINTIWKKDQRWENVDVEHVIDELSEIPLILSMKRFKYNKKAD